MPGTDVTIEGLVLQETGLAILFTDDDTDPDAGVWLPKEHVEWDETSCIMPEWLARDRGLI